MRSQGKYKQNSPLKKSKLIVWIFKERLEIYGFKIRSSLGIITSPR